MPEISKYLLMATKEVLLHQVLILATLAAEPGFVNIVQFQTEHLDQVERAVT